MGQDSAVVGVLRSRADRHCCKGIALTRLGASRSTANRDSFASRNVCSSERNVSKGSHTRCGPLDNSGGKLRCWGTL